MGAGDAVSLLSLAAQRLLGTPLAAPKDLPPGALPQGVVLRAGRLVPMIGGVLGRMGGPAAAVTLGHTIVVHPGRTLTVRLLAHEMAHVRQWEADRLFPLRYTIETLRRGYRKNRYEVEAREAADRSVLDSHPS